MISKKNLDKRICDVEQDAINTQTYREVIHDFEKQLMLIHKNIDELNDEELQDYEEKIGHMWENKIVNTIKSMFLK